MSDGDFYAHEKSVTIAEACEARIEMVAESGEITVLKETVSLQQGEILDASFMNCSMLREFFESQIADAQEKEVLFSLHLKATMMKISDPIMFGHCVKAYFKDVFSKHAQTFEKLGVNANNGLGDVYKKIAGITNLHVPSDIIIDNSMPTAIRAGGKMWNKDDKEEDFKACIPDRSYAGAFAECIDFCKKNGAFDPKTMGACPNVGLMAQKAEEYGSHPTTFEAPKNGTIRIVLKGSNQVLLGHRLQKGDIWRSCQTKDAPIKDWVKLAVRRCQANDFPRNEKPCKAIFWLDPARAHDCQIMEKVHKYLPEVRTDGLDIEIMSPQQAMRVTCERAKQGMNTITVTGNVLRDYLTDLFPILELGTSAKMLSVVPMLAGGGMYETGAGGSAPKHVQQFTKENHLRWDYLGEYLALTCSIEDLARDTDNKAAATLAGALSRAVGRFLDANKNPSRKVKEIDNRGSHYWVARYWAEELAAQGEDQRLKETFSGMAEELKQKEAAILSDMIECQGKTVDIGGYYRVDKAKADVAMNPSATFNGIITRLAQGAERTERYIAWACEMVAALKGTHAALEERFHAEVSLPAGYELGDWERFAREQLRHTEAWEHVHVQDDEVSEQVHTPELDEQRAVLSLLKVAEYVASRNGSQLIDSVKFALLLTEYGIKDPETLKAGLLLGTANGHDRVIAKEFGNEVASILRGLDAPFPSVATNAKANRIRLGKHLHELRKLQWGTLSSPEDIEEFRTLLERTRGVRKILSGSHPPLEEALDDVFGGQVRLASGELMRSNSFLSVLD
ncbi:Isocitrate dehydrogenase [NADP] 2 [Symbiodinium microadriaticum]|uniref:Isocitrate dehydrogenase [NADP] 2 n=1 Tax=Symbiodinium microadriaticum TaxID=2951 RepID=A0A1Q9DTP5_SYMMI|nr:Isocitrate dehydrogenase [NADP] 2 [Symbiodinium microadriaticum]